MAIEQQFASHNLIRKKSSAVSSHRLTSNRFLVSFVKYIGSNYFEKRLNQKPSSISPLDIRPAPRTFHFSSNSKPLANQSWTLIHHNVMMVSSLGMDNLIN